MRVTRHVTESQCLKAVASDAARVVISREGETLLFACDANNFFKRLRGLHGMMPLGPQDALIIRPCKAIHTWRMPATIDVAFISESGLILKCLTVPPGRWSGCRGAKSVVEMAKGTIGRLDLKAGDQLSASGKLWSGKA